MPASRFQPDAVFKPAVAGTRVRLATMVSSVVVGVMAVVVPVVVLTLNQHERHPPPWPVAFAPVVVVAVLAVVWVTARIRCYRVTAEELRVELPLRTVRFALAGLQSVAPDPGALRGARRIMGNDGVGAVSGRFRSKHLGWFRVYLTDVEHAVVLRWPDRCLVISPQQHSWFVDTLRRRLDLPH